MLLTVPAVAVKFAVVAPALTVTEAGTVSAVLLEESPTEAPPVRAAEDNVTVQMLPEPDATELGEHDRPETAGTGGVTVTVVVTLPFNVAVTVTVWLLDTVPAVVVKFAVVAPAVTATAAGTVSAALFEASPTDAPLVSAGELSVTVHVDVPPDTTELGEHDTPEIAGAGGVTVTVVVALPFNVAVTVTV